ncbi:hypothetical protein WG907_04255 [Sphingobium sp. AN558]|uniref:hypothetical protein n=1 Tax=Sphingobium sp. AN558 TaxID=3133442 RepID=UPI0030C28709
MIQSICDRIINEVEGTRCVLLEGHSGVCRADKDEKGEVIRAIATFILRQKQPVRSLNQLSGKELEDILVRARNAHSYACAQDFEELSKFSDDLKQARDGQP